jgi:HSP20 family protein
MSEKEEGSEKETQRKNIEPWYPRDMFRTFDDMWSEFRRDFLMPRPRRSGVRPWWRRGQMEKREACTDLIETNDEYHVCAEVPGIPKDNINITVTENDIEISAKAETEKKKEETGYILNERGYSEIYRKMIFPEEVIPERAEATVKNGLLEIKIPKKLIASEIQRHKVEIE